MRTIGTPFIKWPPLLLLGFLCRGAMGDTIVLKTGVQLEGTITAESDTEYTVEYRVSPSITDTRKITKSDVEKVEKVRPDEKAYLEVKSLKVGANSLPPASYDQIAAALHSFLRQFPESAHAAEIQQTAAELNAEKQRVDAGEVKMDNRWISKQDVQKERVQLTGQAFYRYMSEQARRGDFVGAMNSFDQVEKLAAGSRAYPEAIELAKQILPSLKSAADRMLSNQKYLKAEHAAGMKLLSGADLAETAAAEQRELKQAEAALAAASKMGQAWPPMLADSDKALASISTKATEEEKKLAELPVDKMRESISLAENARTQLAAGKYTEAADSLKAAQSSWSANELAMRLTAELTSVKTKLPVSAPPPVATPKPAATPRPAPRPSAEATAAPVSAPPEAEDRSFFARPIGIAAIVLTIVVVLGSVTVYRKIAARSSEVSQ